MKFLQLENSDYINVSLVERFATDTVNGLECMCAYIDGRTYVIYSEIVSYTTQDGKVIDFELHDHKLDYVRLNLFFDAMWREIFKLIDSHSIITQSDIFEAFEKLLECAAEYPKLML
jgi:hypothetical protein